ARLLLERLRNKRLMFVGDSLKSMLCLVSVGDPVARPKVPGQVRGAQRLSQCVHGGGLQRDGGVLLGAPTRTTRRRTCWTRHRLAVHSQARPALLSRPLPRLQRDEMVAGRILGRCRTSTRVQAQRNIFGQTGHSTCLVLDRQATSTVSGSLARSRRMKEYMP
uniref:Uncharacterized protein n=1 Tax=Aegilops tauschii subsp. strangulata TaxID=200361 RepID=A0A453HVM4_AEGTS